ncbi:hypothetical protein DES39_0638 [Orbus hercynius]|uniref:Uncharacterized protein n=1 Tax=Orbus hercynius TaxID=593135 RepID=A0A495RJ98_9GAMM|nr:hypothetical protein DES39_0638 [Orbus hercynius]
MRKLMLVISAVLAITFISTPSYANNPGIADSYLNTGIRLVDSSSNVFFNFCHYELYNKDTGTIIYSYVTTYTKFFFSSCPTH